MFGSLRVALDQSGLSWTVATASCEVVDPNSQHSAPTLAARRCARAVKADRARIDITLM